MFFGDAEITQNPNLFRTVPHPEITRECSRQSNGPAEFINRHPCSRLPLGTFEVKPVKAGSMGARREILSQKPHEFIAIPV